jgi:autotransporter-associated beta strand protein
LTSAFKTFSNLVLPTPTAPDGMLRLRFETFNDTESANEATGFDSILISGTPLSLGVSITSPTPDQPFLPGTLIPATAAPVAGTAPYTVRFYTDISGSYQQIGGDVTSPPYQVNLGTPAIGTYHVYATATDSTSTTVTSGTHTFTVETDTTAPTPNPMTFAIAPGPAGADSVVMTATTATDTLSPPVQYYFENTTTSNNSGWISGTAWTDTGLSSLTVYGYRVKARDTAGNETGWSAVANAMTPGWATTSLFWDGGTAHIAGNGNGASQGGSGTWNTAIQNWDLGADYPHVAWYNPNNDTAVFGGTAGTVTLGTNITVGGLTFTAAYTLMGGTVTFGAPGTISNPANVTIASALAGTGPIIKSGAGTLTLSGSNTFSGGVVVNAGSLSVSATSNLSSGSITFDGSATVYSSNGGLNGAWPITLNNGAIATFTGQGSQWDYQFFTTGAVTGDGGIYSVSSGGNSGGASLKLRSTANSFTGPIYIGSASKNGLVYVNSLADSASPIQFGYGTGANGFRIGCTFVYDTGAIADLVLSNRYFVLSGVASPSNNILNDSGKALTVNTDLRVTGTGSITLSLGGTGAGISTFAGKIVDGPGAVVKLSKAETGQWILSSANTYSGGTAVGAGTLKATAASALGTGNVTVTGGTLVIDAADAMAGTAALRLPSATAKNLTMNANATVGSLFLAGLQQPNGAYSAATNASEYFLGGNTNTTGFTALPGVSNSGSTLSVTWTKAADYTGTYGTDFFVETSASLSGGWAPDALAPAGNVTITGNNVTYTFPSPLGARKFARLKVTGP